MKTHVFMIKDANRLEMSLRPIMFVGGVTAYQDYDG